MSSLLGGGQGLAGLARVAFESTGVGETTRDIERVEQVYRSSTSEMSDSAIKVQLAQERLQRSLRKGPAAFQSQANAELALRRAERELRGETDATTRSLDRQQRELSQLGRGTVAGSGALRGLGRNLAYASAGFLGGAGLIYGMRQALSIASNLEEQTARVGVTFGESARDVIEWSRSTSTSMGIAQDQALAYAGTLGSILKASGQTRDESANLSRELVQLAADMASFNNASPEETLAAIRSGLTGEIEPLRRYGVLLSEAASRQEALRMTGKASAAELTQGDKVLARYSLILKQTTDQQGDYVRTADSLANSQRTLSALWREAQGIVGQALAPAFTDAVQGLRDWLAEDKNRITLQRDVNAVVGDGVTVVRAFAGGLKLVKEAGEPVVDMLGGLADAVEIAISVFLIKKLGLAALAMSALRAASARTTVGIVADNALISRSYDGVTAAAGRAAVAAGSVGTVGVRGGRVVTTGGRRGIPPVLTGNPALATLGAILVTAGASGAKEGDRRANREALGSGQLAGQFPLLTAVYRRAVNGNATAAEMAVLRRTDFSSTQGMAQAERDLAALRDPVGTRGDRGRPNQGRAVPEPRDRDRGGDGGGRRPRTLADILLDQARAGATADTADDLRFHREAARLLQRQIDNLERRKNLTTKQKERLRGLYDELAREQAAIASIVEEGEAKITAQQEAAAKKADAAERKRQEQLEKIIASAERAAERRGKLFKDVGSLDTRAELRAAALRGLDPKTGKGGLGAKKRAADKGLTMEDFREQSFAFLGSLTNVRNDFGGNVQMDGAGWALHSQADNAQRERQQQTHLLNRLVSGVSHQDTRYIWSTQDVFMDGVGAY